MVLRYLLRPQIYRTQSALPTKFSVPTHRLSVTPLQLSTTHAESAAAKAAGPLRRQHCHFLFDRNPRSGSTALTAELRVATNSL